MLRFSLSARSNCLCSRRARRRSLSSWVKPSSSSSSPEEKQSSPTMWQLELSFSGVSEGVSLLAFAGLLLTGVSASLRFCNFGETEVAVALFPLEGLASNCCSFFVNRNVSNTGSTLLMCFEVRTLSLSGETATDEDADERSDSSDVLDEILVRFLLAAFPLLWAGKGSATVGMSLVGCSWFLVGLGDNQSLIDLWGLVLLHTFLKDSEAFEDFFPSFDFVAEGFKASWAVIIFPVFCLLTRRISLSFASVSWSRLSLLSVSWWRLSLVSVSWSRAADDNPFSPAEALMELSLQLFCARSAEDGAQFFSSKLSSVLHGEHLFFRWDVSSWVPVKCVSYKDGNSGTRFATSLLLSAQAAFLPEVVLLLPWPFCGVLCWSTPLALIRSLAWSSAQSEPALLLLRPFCGVFCWSTPMAWTRFFDGLSTQSELALLLLRPFRGVLCWSSPLAWTKSLAWSLTLSEPALLLVWPFCGVLCWSTPLEWTRSFDPLSMQSEPALLLVRPFCRVLFWSTPLAWTRPFDWLSMQSKPALPLLWPFCGVLGWSTPLARTESMAWSSTQSFLLWNIVFDTCCELWAAAALSEEPALFFPLSLVLPVSLGEFLLQFKPALTDFIRRLPFPFTVSVYKASVHCGTVAGLKMPKGLRGGGTTDDADDGADGFEEVEGWGETDRSPFCVPPGDTDRLPCRASLRETDRPLFFSRTGDTGGPFPAVGPLTPSPCLSCSQCTTFSSFKFFTPLEDSFITESAPLSKCTCEALSDSVSLIGEWWLTWHLNSSREQREYGLLGWESLEEWWLWGRPFTAGGLADLACLKKPSSMDPTPSLMAQLLFKFSSPNSLLFRDPMSAWYWPARCLLLDATHELTMGKWVVEKQLVEKRTLGVMRTTQGNVWMVFDTARGGVFGHVWIGLKCRSLLTLFFTPHPSKSSQTITESESSSWTLTASTVTGSLEYVSPISTSSLLAPWPRK